MIGWPVIDRIGPVSPHGLGIAVGYLAGSWWMLREGRKRGVNEDHVGTILLWALVGAIVGARLFYVLGHLEEYRRASGALDFGEMLRVWEGGISLIGGIAGGVGFAYPILRRYGYRFLQVMDSAAIGLAFGVFVGRIGDLVIGDHLGKPTDFLLGWGYRGGDLPGPWSRITTGCPPEGWEAQLQGGFVECLSRDGAQLFDAGPTGGTLVSSGAGVHQTALYDFLIAGVLFLFLRWLSRRPRREGVLIMSFAILYGAGRVVTDFLRVDKTWLGLGLTGSQLTAIGVIVLSLFTLFRYWRKPLPAALPIEEFGEEPSQGETALDEAPHEPIAERIGPTTVFTPPSEPGPEGSGPERLPTPGVPTEPEADVQERPPTPAAPSESPADEEERPTTSEAPTEPETGERERPSTFGRPAESDTDEDDRR